MKLHSIFKNALCSLMASCLVGLCQAQTLQVNNGNAKELVTKARSYQYGLKGNVDINKAVELYQAAAQQNDTKAMNALGIMYLKGEGVKKDSIKAYEMFMQGANLHDGASLCNLGAMYLKGNGVEQDFDKSFRYFKEAADSSYVMAYYHVGYLYYKGQGTPQSYAKAISYFRLGAKKHNSACFYMLACCYMDGYGVKQDFDKTKKLFMESLRLGNGWVGDVIATGVLDSIRNHPHLAFTSLTDVKKHRFDPMRMPASVNHSDASSLKGKWTGKLYTYDWSRTIVEKEEDITLEFAKNDYQITGKWYAGSHLRLQFKAEKNDKCWKVTEQQGDSALMAKEVLKSLVCSAGFNQMRGNITVYSQSAKEPLKPSCFILDKVNPGANDEAPIIINHYYPNPVDNLLHIDFTVNRADNVTFQISDIMGRPCFTTEKKAYDPGYYSVTLRPTLATGNYTLVVVDDHGRWARKIIKK